MDFLKRIFSNFIELTRAYALPVTFASLIVIWAFSRYYIDFTYINFVLLVFALCCVHLGANLFDDYIDVKKKLKNTNSINEISFERFTLKADLILKEVFSMKEVEIIISSLFFFPILIGLYFAITVTPYVLVFAFLGAILALFYPISPKYCLGEIVIGLIYGPLMINGGYLAMTGEMNFSVFYVSIAVFFAVIVLLHTDNIMDWEFDIKEGKKTLCILSGSKIKAINVLKIIIATAYLIIVGGVLGGFLNPNSLYVFLTLPIATKLTESLIDYINIKDIQFVPRWYYGPFENWETIKKNKIDFFMYRMYLGRNFALFFAIFLAIGTIV